MTEYVDPADEACGGIPAGCPECIRIYREWGDGSIPLCLVCGLNHWAAEPCAGRQVCDD